MSKKIQLPEGYAFAYVPRDARVISREFSPSPNPVDHGGPSSNSPISNIPVVSISASSNAAKIIVAIFQSLYGSLTLYQTRGDQLDRYGYAAFGLTVAPYAVMSIVNLMGCLMTPSYPTMYLVHSTVLDEINNAHNHGRPYFDGTVGTLVEVPSSQVGSGGNIREGTEEAAAAADVDKVTLEEAAVPSDVEQTRIQRIDIKWRRWLGIIPYPVTTPRSSQSVTAGSYFYYAFWALRPFLVFITTLGAPFFVNAAISKFEPGKSTKAQRVWTMTWLSFGSFFGFGFRGTFSSDTKSSILLAVLFLGTPAIGGFVVVGQMLKEYGDCIRFD